MKRETFTVAIVVATACVVPLLLYKANTHPAADPAALGRDIDALDDVSFDLDDTELSAPLQQPTRQLPQ